MSDVVRGLLDQVATLSDDELGEFLEGLDEMLDPERLSDQEWESAWADEVNRRMEDMLAGRAKAIPADEVMRDLREKYG